MGFEVMMVATAMYQLLEGSFGITERGLYGTMATFAGFTMVRVVFLFVKPGWMEGGVEGGKKVR